MAQTNDVEDAILISEHPERCANKESPKQTDLRSAAKLIEYFVSITVATLTIVLVLTVVLLVWGFVAMEMIDILLNEPVR